MAHLGEPPSGTSNDSHHLSLADSHLAFRSVEQGDCESDARASEISPLPLVITGGVKDLAA